MKRIIAFAVLIVMALPSFGQIPPRLNDESVLKKLRVKTIRTFYYDHEDTTKATKKHLWFQQDYDATGNLVSRYQLSLWDDVVSYDHTTSFTYDGNNKLTQKVVIQKILNLEERDDEFIKEFGDDPINEMFRYYYNDKNQLIKMESFTFGKDGLNETAKPDNTITYEYSKRLLIKEVGKTMGEIPSEYLARYEYNSAKQKTLESKVYWSESYRTGTTTKWIYNDKGQLTEKVVEDSTIPVNNRQFKYEYNAKGKLIRELELSPETNEWETLLEYYYDKSGNEIWSDDQTTYEFYPNGLVKQELMKNKSSDETVNFVTVYSFH